MTKDIHNLQPSDVLTLDEALEATVLGYNVRAVDMAEGTFIRYDFAGFRIHHAGGASSGWTQRDHDATVDWHVLPDEHYDAYKRVIAERDGVVERQQAEAKAKWGQGFMRDIQQQGRALREPPVGDVLIIDHAGKWGLPPKPVEAKPAPDNVGKWGKAVVPTKDKWGRSI